MKKTAWRMSRHLPAAELLCLDVTTKRNQRQLQDYGNRGGVTIPEGVQKHGDVALSNKPSGYSACTPNLPQLTPSTGRKECRFIFPHHQPCLLLKCSLRSGRWMFALHAPAQSPVSYITQ